MKRPGRRHPKTRPTIARPSYGKLENRTLLAGITFDPVTGIAEVLGTNAQDTLTVATGANQDIEVDLQGIETRVFTSSELNQVTFFAFGGDDVFVNSTIVASYVVGGPGMDSLTGGLGADQIFGGDDNDVISGGDGDDFLRGDSDNDLINGGLGNDQIVADDGDDTVNGDAGDDHVLGGFGDDQIRGGNGHDEIYGNAGNDRIWGGNGNDLLVGQEDHDRIFGDRGHDDLYGNTGDDTLQGNDGADWLVGGSGNDILFGNQGADRAFGQDGDDWISGGDQSDRILGEAGNDRLLGDEGNDRVWGGDDDDWILGHGGSDVLFGELGNDRMVGGDDADYLYGNEGDDQVNGGNGDDSILGNLGNDHLIGGEGSDRIVGHEGNDVMLGGHGADELFGGAGLDILLGGEGDDRLIGGDDDDYLRGDEDDDLIYAGAGNDTLLGSDDDDRLFGQQGDDYLRGEKGLDILVGNAGADVLDGGLGDDDLYDDPDDRVVEDDEDTDDEQIDYAERHGALPNRITVSFAADGTSIFDEGSSLFTAFSSVLTEEAIRESVLGAFDLWAQHGNLDVGWVADSGDAFGTPGRVFGDSRFGDVRIGAIPMPNDVHAVAIGHHEFVSGTWAGEILFNANHQFNDVDDFFALALHEIGHVLGMEHTTDLNSVMHRYSDRTTLHAIDVANFQALFGQRSLDQNEDDETNNDTMLNATNLRFEGDDPVQGEIPAIVFGDISNSADIDFFRLRIPDSYTGPTTVRVISDGISQLEMKASLLTDSGELIETKNAAASHGDTLTFQREVSGEDRYFIKIESAVNRQIGSFAVVVELDDRTTISESDLMNVVRGREFSYLDTEDIFEYFSNPSGFLLNDDLHTNDDLASALDLNTEDGFEARARFEYQASLADATDIDFYRFEGAETSSAGRVMNITVRSLEFEGIAPLVTLMDHQGNPLTVETIVNGQGEVVVQFVNPVAGAKYYVSVGSDPLPGFANGNYELAISYTSDVAPTRTMGAGQLDSTESQFHSLHVAQSQMFQFALDAGNVGGTQPLIWATIFDQQGSVVHRMAALGGERRTSGAVYLAPGSYVIEVRSVGDSSFTGLDYSILGIDVGDPQGPSFSDPSESPFEQNGDGEFTYPDDIVSLDTFISVDGISSNQEKPPADIPPANLRIWYWGLF